MVAARARRRRWPGTTFPVADEALLVDDTVEMPVQVNGKLRAVITVPADADAAALEAAARADERVVAALDGARDARGSSPCPAASSTSSSELTPGLPMR